MIKVITSFVSCLAAILLGILALATDFWRVWWKEDKEIEGVQYHHEGLFQTCSETTINGTVLAVDRCTDLHELGRPDWNAATIALMIIGLICHLFAFVFTIVTTACRKGHPFPSFFIGGLFVAAAIAVIIALLVYTFHNWQSDVFFSWSYGGGWSTVALSIIAFVLIMADR
ncbi:claudin domain-containing protein 2-like isoform X1 [Orbicella faveolata]|uniref:claudin domain-containing protein 2-like isoform X1 n=1 Tax=Orbicella faveolata TaxID=48498 RepID=UPI0009E2E27A|nr:claudin domain-containing protein 2-like isoform X1 [Orbicella faveolata]